MTQEKSEVMENNTNTSFKLAILTCCKQSFVMLVALFFLLSIPSSVYRALPDDVRNATGPFPIPPLKKAKPVEDLFPVTEKLRPQVDFWKKIFTEYSTRHALIHDDWYLNVIYEVIDLDSTEFPTRKTAWKAVRNARKKYRDILAKLSEKWAAADELTEEQISELTKEEKRVYLMFKDIPESLRFRKKDAKKRVHIQLGHADSFKIGIIRSGTYMAAMKKILAEHDLPEELAYLPMIESSFNAFSISYVGATGMWQIMKETGKRYNLEINRLLDERRDPLLSTGAAARILAHNYEVMKSWPLAITAYNHGLQGMRNAVRQADSEDIADVIERYDGSRFKFASRNFYAEFVAAVDVFSNYEEYYGDIERDDPLDVIRVNLSDYITVETLEVYCQIPGEELKRLNPAIHDSLFEPDSFIPIHYPLNMLAEHKISLDTWYDFIPDSLKFDYIPSSQRHRVAKGQTLSEIAKRYDVSVRQLMRFNGIRHSRKITVGQWIEIPGEYISCSGKLQVQNKPVPDTRHHAANVHSLLKLSEITSIYNISMNTFGKVSFIKSPVDIRNRQPLHIPEG